MKESLTGLVNTEPWVAQAACGQIDPESFFPEKGYGSVSAAKKICASCPVRGKDFPAKGIGGTGECLEYALRKGERFGIWGGLTERERRRMSHGLPPKPPRTHCQRGHDLAVVGVTPQRACKACRQQWKREYHFKNEAQRAKYRKDGAA
jgi:hypothetical protein